MHYLIEVRINGYTSLVTDCYDNEDQDNVWRMYEELCSVEEAGGSQEDFDAVLAAHGCTSGGAGVMYDCDFQGFPVQTAPDGTKFVTINGGHQEVVNITYVPDIVTSFSPGGFFSGW